MDILESVKSKFTSYLALVALDKDGLTQQDKLLVAEKLTWQVKNKGLKYIKGGGMKTTYFILSDFFDDNPSPNKETVLKAIDTVFETITLA
jgi:hypothetical protein